MFISLIIMSRLYEVLPIKLYILSQNCRPSISSFSVRSENNAKHTVSCVHIMRCLYIVKRTIVKFPTKILFPYQLTPGKFVYQSLDPLIDWLIEGLIQLIDWLIDWIVFYAVSAVICNSGQWPGSQDLEMQDYWYKITWKKIISQ